MSMTTAQRRMLLAADRRGYTFVGRGQAGTAKALERRGFGNYRPTDYYGSRFEINGLGKSAALSENGAPDA